MNKRILVVEDAPAIMKLVTFVLKREGYEVTGTDRIHEAKDILAYNTFDLIVLDQNLSDGLGEHLLQHIREDLKRTVPIIMLSAVLTPEAIRTMFDKGINDYMVKPVRNKELLARVKEWIGSHVAG